MSQRPPETSPASAASRGIRVVLVDDCRVARAAIARLLALYPMVRITGEAGNGPRGFALAAELQPDLIITDIQMPGFDGLELVDRLHRTCPGIRSLVTSIHDGPVWRRLCKERGADGFINKHRLPDELPEFLERLFPAVAESEAVRA